MANAGKLTGFPSEETPLPPLRSVPSASPRTVDVSILIVTWNSARFIDRCLEALPAACDGFTYEGIVHDNASDDDTLQGVAPDANVILRAPQTAGFAAGPHHAFSASRGRDPFLLN